MNFSSNFIEELRDRLSLAEIAGRKLVWDQKKTNSNRGDYWAPCPFHNEKTASFHVDDNKGFYYCFGCHAKGDAFAFLKESENLSFTESVRVIASHVGVQLPDEGEGDKIKRQNIDNLFTIHEMAISFYATQLVNSNNLNLHKLLKKRNLEKSVCLDFQIGFAPNENKVLFDYLVSKKFLEKEILESGLCARDQQSNRIYDRFKNRLMFPIRNSRGQAVGFGGRALSTEAMAKYLNSPDTKVFQKGKLLYNSSKARKNASKSDQLFVVEGYMDVIALSIAGVTNCVAPLGTAITAEQLKLLWRMNSEPILAFDGDEAGLRAAMKLLDLAIPEISAQNTIRFCLLPSGQDPDDLLNVEGKEALREILKHSVSVADLLWIKETRQKNFDSPERKAALDVKLKQTINKITDKSLKAYFRESLTKKRDELYGLNSNRKPIQTYTDGRSYDQKRWLLNDSKNNKFIHAAKETKQSNLGRTQASSKIETQIQESAILLGIINHPDIIPVYLEELSQVKFISIGLEKILNTVLDSVNKEIVSRDELIIQIDLTLGFNVLEKLYSYGHLKVNPHLKKDSLKADTVIVIKDALERQSAYLSMEEELKDAEFEISASSDEGLTMRLSQANQVLRAATKGRTEEATEEGENSKEDAEVIRGLIKDKIWIKKRTSKRTNQ